MEKLVYLVWSPPGRTPPENHAVMLGQIAPALLALGPRRLWVQIDDEDSQVAVPMPPPEHEPSLAAAWSLWLDRYDDRAPYEDVLRTAGDALAGYLVTESLYTDYGDNEFAAPRDWPDGNRSPGVVMVTLLEQPARFGDEEWYAHWHGVQSPVSERLQPRARYVRNSVARAVTAGAPPWRGIVEEAWPSAEHLTDPHRFYRASTDDELAEHLREMLDSVTGFLDLDRIRSYTTSEYFLAG